MKNSTPRFEMGDISDVLSSSTEHGLSESDRILIYALLATMSVANILLIIVVAKTCRDNATGSSKEKKDKILHASAKLYGKRHEVKLSKTKLNSRYNRTSQTSLHEMRGESDKSKNNSQLIKQGETIQDPRFELYGQIQEAYVNPVYNDFSTYPSQRLDRTQSTTSFSSRNDQFFYGNRVLPRQVSIDSSNQFEGVNLSSPTRHAQSPSRQVSWEV